MKKQNNKNTRIGRNIHGDSCIIKEVVLEKETALAQYIEIVNDIEQHRKLNINIEYEIKLPKDVFSKQEIDELNRKLRSLMMLRCGMNNMPFREYTPATFPCPLKAI